MPEYKITLGLFNGRASGFDFQAVQSDLDQFIQKIKYSDRVLALILYTKNIPKLQALALYTGLTANKEVNLQKSSIVKWPRS